jgi:hypothetical protein
MTAQVRQQAQLGKLDFLVVEGVMEMMQWANRGGEQQVMYNLFPTIVGGRFWSHGHMGRDSDTRKVLMCLERRSFWSGLEDSLTY